MKTTIKIYDLKYSQFMLGDYKTHADAYNDLARLGITPHTNIIAYNDKRQRYHVLEVLNENNAYAGV